MVTGPRYFLECSCGCLYVYRCVNRAYAALLLRTSQLSICILISTSPVGASIISVCFCFLDRKVNRPSKESHSEHTEMSERWCYSASHHAQSYLKVSEDLRDCKCNLHLATWTGCLISSWVFPLLVSAVMCSSRSAVLLFPRAQQTSRWLPSLPRSIYVSTGHSITLTAQIYANTIMGRHQRAL